MLQHFPPHMQHLNRQIHKVHIYFTVIITVFFKDKI